MSKMFKCLSLLVLLSSSLSFARVFDTHNARAGDHKIICYWGSWSFYRPGAGQYDPKNMDPNLCTHMMYGFAKLNEQTNKIEVFEEGLDLGSEDPNSGLPWGRGMYAKFNALRQQNPNLKTIVSIGGWNEGSDKYSRMAANPSSRATFVQSVVAFLDQHKFNGLDVDWEYPGQRAVGDQDRVPGDPADKDNYVALLRELRAALQPKGYLLGAAVSAGAPTIDFGYNVKEISPLLDIINLMTYDFNGGWDERTAHNAPLYPWDNANEKDTQFTVSYAVNHWIQLGVDPKKIMMGLPLYGRGFTLKDPSNHGLQAPTVGKGSNEGPYTRQVGILGYNEICDNFKTQPDWAKYRDDTQKIPYAIRGDQWIGYDDKQSLRDKIAFLKSKGLGGVCVWSIDMDDFSGNCGEGKNPLLTEINSSLNGYTPSPDPNPPQPDPPTPGPGGDFVCTSPGTYVDPNDPSVYHECLDSGNGQLVHHVRNCPPGTIFDQTHLVCVHKY